MEALKVQTIWQWSIGTWCMGFQFTSFCRHSSLTTVDMKHCPRSVHHNLLQNATKWFCWPPFMQMLCRRHTTMSIVFKKKLRNIFENVYLRNIFQSDFDHQPCDYKASGASFPPQFLPFFLSLKQTSHQAKEAIRKTKRLLTSKNGLQMFLQCSACTTNLHRKLAFSF